MEICYKQVNNGKKQWYVDTPGPLVYTTTRRAAEWLVENWQSAWVSAHSVNLSSMAEREARKEAIARKVGFAIKGRNLVIYANSQQRRYIASAIKDAQQHHALTAVDQLVIADYLFENLEMGRMGWSSLDEDVLDDAPAFALPEPVKHPLVIGFNVKMNANFEPLAVDRVYITISGAAQELVSTGQTMMTGVDIDMVYGCPLCGSDFNDAGVCPYCDED